MAGFGDPSAMRDFAYYRHLTKAQLQRLWLECSDNVDKQAVENELLERGLTGPTDWELGAERKEKFDRVLLIIWVVLLIPWLPFALASGMAFDNGNTAGAWLLVLSTWLYGPAVFGAFKLRTRYTAAVFLPIVSVAGVMLSNLFQ
jgi:hypothetical protein